jgi:hypothetical protein
MSASPKKANARRRPGERANELTNGSGLRPRACDVNRTYGPSELCTWSVGPGICRFQTNQPCIARKLSQRTGAQLSYFGLGRSYYYQGEQLGYW